LYGPAADAWPAAHGARLASRKEASSYLHFCSPMTSFDILINKSALSRKAASGGQDLFASAAFLIE